MDVMSKISKLGLKTVEPGQKKKDIIAEINEKTAIIIMQRIICAMRLV